MMLSRCAYCDLPVRIHFAWCKGIGIFGPMPEASLRPGAIVFEAAEMRWLKPRPALPKPRKA